MSEIGLHKILGFPGKIRQIMNTSDVRPDPSYPTVVELSLTNKCNLTCTWCSDLALRKSKPGSLTLDTLTALFKDLSEGGASSIVIEGGGEPTIHPQFGEIVKRAKGFGLSLGMLTNGATNNVHRYAEHFDWIRISMDATTQAEHTQHKGPGSLRIVKRNALLAKEKCPVVGLGFVVAEGNCSDPVGISEWAREYGLSYVHFRQVIDHPELLPKAPLPTEKLLGLKSDDFGVMVFGMDDNAVTGNAGRPCRASSLHTVIAANGDVYFCGRLNIHPDWPPIGNIRKQSFHEIWTGHERFKQHRKMMDGENCQRLCPACRITKWNVQFDDAANAKTGMFL